MRALVILAVASLAGCRARTPILRRRHIDASRHLDSLADQKSGSSCIVIRGYFAPDGRRFSGDNLWVRTDGTEYDASAFIMFVNDGATACPNAP